MIEPRLDPVTAAPAFHGGPSSQDAHEPPVGLDFSTNVNAFGPPPIVLGALRAADPATYPDPIARAPRAAFARWCDISYERVALTAGACDALDRVARAFLTTGDVALIAAPAFAEYARAASMAGAEVRKIGAEERHADSPVERILEAIHQLRPASSSSPRRPARSAWRGRRTRSTPWPTRCEEKAS